MAAPLPGIELDGESAAAWRRLYEEVPDWRHLRPFAEYWADGHRTLAEISRLVALETGQDIGPAIETYFRLLAQANLMEWVEV